MVPRRGNQPESDARAGMFLFLVLCALTGALAIFFAVSETIRWREMNPPLLTGTIALAAAVFLHAWRTGSARNALLFFLLAVGISAAAEYAGIRWGIPFGVRFSYHADLRPRLFGCVPLFIPLAWTVLAYIPVVVLREWGSERSPSLRPRLPKAVPAAAILCIADLSLDPLAVAVGAWAWERPGVYFGIPASNFLGWFLVGLAIYGSYFSLERPAATRSASISVYDRCFIAAALFLALVGHVALVRHVPGGAWIILVTAVSGAPGLLFWVSHLRSGPPGPAAGQPL